MCHVLQFQMPTNHDNDRNMGTQEQKGQTVRIIHDAQLIKARKQSPEEWKISTENIARSRAWLAGSSKTGAKPFLGIHSLQGLNDSAANSSITTWVQHRLHFQKASLSIIDVVREREAVSPLYPSTSPVPPPSFSVLLPERSASSATSIFLVLRVLGALFFCVI